MSITIPDVEPLSTYTVGNTAQTDFDFTWAWFEDDEIRVLVDDVEVTQFTVTAATGAASTGYVGGTLTLTSAVSNAEVIIWRDPPFDRTTSFQETGPFNMKQLERELDRLVSLDQVLEMLIGRALSKPIGSDDYNALGRAILNGEDGSQFATRAYVNSLLLNGGGGGAIAVEEFTPSAGQTVFTTSTSYVTGSSLLYVYINGILQAPSTVTEDSATQFTLAPEEPLTADDLVTAVITIPLEATTVAASAVTYLGSNVAALLDVLVGRTGDEIAAGKTPSVYGRLEIDIRRYGAVGDDATDNSTALADAIAVAQQTGAVIKIPRGTFRFSTGLVLPRDPSVSIVGEHPETSVLKYTGSGKAISYSIAVANVVDLFRLENFTLDCTASTASNGIELTNAAAVNGFRWGSLRNLYIYGADQASSVGLNLDGVNSCHFENLVIRDWNDGVSVTKSNQRSAQNSFIKCTTISCANAGWNIVNEARSWQLIGCRCEGDGVYGFYVEGGLSISEDHLFIGCESEDDYTTADFQFENCVKVTMIGGGPGTDTQGDGIKLVNTDHSTFVGLSFRTYAGVGKYALTIDANSKNNKFFNCYVEDSADWGAISVAAGNDRNMLDFNYSGEDSMPMRVDGIAVPVVEVSSTPYTLDVRVGGLYLVDATSANIAVNLAAVTDGDHEGTQLTIKKVDSGANTVTINPSGAATVDGAASKVLSTQYDFATIVADSSGNWHIVAS